MHLSSNKTALPCVALSFLLYIPSSHVYLQTNFAIALKRYTPLLLQNLELEKHSCLIHYVVSPLACFLVLLKVNTKIGFKNKAPILQNVMPSN